MSITPLSTSTHHATGWVFSALAVCVATLVIFILEPTSMGLHALPFMLCAAILGKDGIDWLRGRLDRLDPTGLLGLFGFIYFLISPLLQIGWDAWFGIPSFNDNLGWVSLWGWLNFLGILIYKAILSQPFTQRPAWVEWHPHPTRFWMVAGGLLILTAVVQVMIYIKFGGISGFIQAFTLRQELNYRNYDPFEGWGVPILIAESFKFILAAGIVMAVRQKPWAQTFLFFCTFMLVMLVVAIIFGGLKGSRGSTVYALFLAAGMYHFLVSPLSMKTITIGLIGLSLFMGAYAVYKKAGSYGFAFLTRSDAQTYVINQMGMDNDKFILVRDFGRMDIQTLTLKEIYGEGGLSLSYGRSYLVAPLVIIPNALWRNQPPSFTKEKTEITQGPGSFDPTSPRQTTLLFGQFGEAIINFGIMGVFMFYTALGFATRGLKLALIRLPAGDARWLALPILCLLPIQLMMYDFNQLFQFYFKHLFLLALLITWGTQRRI